MQKIRAREDSASIATADRLHVQLMSSSWGSGNATVAMTSQNNYNIAYDNHRYQKYDPSVEVSKSGYIDDACGFTPGPESPIITGEWSISPSSEVEKNSDWIQTNTSNNEFYKQWFAAQITGYERGLGWVFWAWKQQLNDYRWGYQGESTIHWPILSLFFYTNCLDAVNAGVVPTNISSLFSLGACDGQ